MECYRRVNCVPSGRVIGDAPAWRLVTDATPRSLLLELPGFGGVGELAGDGEVEVLLAQRGAQDNAACELDLDGLPLFQGGGGDLLGEHLAQHVAVLRLAKRIGALFAE